MDKEIIADVFRRLMDNQFNSKCKPLSEIRSDLSKLSQVEKNELLNDKLNKSEKDYYNYLLNHKQNLNKVIEEHESVDKNKFPEGMVDSLLREFHKSEKEIDDLLFRFERKIFDKSDDKVENNITVDMSRYRQEKDSLNEDSSNVKLGIIERDTINNQRSVDFNQENISALTSYYSDGFAMLNSRLNNGKHWSSLTKDAQKYYNKKLNKMEKSLSNAISKTSGLSEPTRLYHNGSFDVSLVEGDHIKFKGYLSTSFQKQVATSWTEVYNESKVNYTYELLCDKGTKGVCANDSSHGTLTHMNYEHEYLLDKGLEGDIVNIDVENHIVTVLV